MRKADELSESESDFEAQCEDGDSSDDYFGIGVPEFESKSKSSKIRKVAKSSSNSNKSQLPPGTLPESGKTTGIPTPAKRRGRPRKSEAEKKNKPTEQKKLQQQSNTNVGGKFSKSLGHSEMKKTPKRQRAESGKVLTKQTNAKTSQPGGNVSRRSTPTKPKIKTSTSSPFSTSALPQLGEDFDFTEAAAVTAFSSFLTSSVHSFVSNVDPSPSRRSRSKNGYKEFFDEEGEEDEETESEEHFSDSILDEDDEEDFEEERRKSSSSKKKTNLPGSAKDTSTSRSRSGGRGANKKPRKLRGPPPRTEGPKTKRENTPRMCSVCGKILISQWNLTMHMRVHTDDKRFVCDFEGCGKRFYKTENLRTHMRMHTQERPYLCEVCNCRFAYRVVMRTHKAAKHQIYDSEAVYECSSCSKKFITDGLLNKHWKGCRKHDGSMDYKVYCAYCNVHFENGEEFKVHQQQQPHIDIKNVKMQELRQKSMNNKEAAKSISEVSCLHCDEKFPDNRLLNIHISKMHTLRAKDNTKFCCDICGKVFATLGSLKTHTVTHSEIKPFSCSECDKSFNTKQSLILHQSKHEGFPHNCPYCGKGFYKLRSHLRHLCTRHRDIHLQGKEFVCKCCYNNFATEQELSRHLEEHKDVTCSVCAKVLRDKHELKRHMKSDHPTNPQPQSTDEDEMDDGSRLNQREEGAAAIEPMPLVMDFRHQYAVFSQDERQRGGHAQGFSRMAMS